MTLAKFERAVQAAEAAPSFNLGGLFTTSDPNAVKHQSSSDPAAKMTPSMENFKDDELVNHAL